MNRHRLYWSAMGSSRYEADPNKLDRDIASREALYADFFNKVDKGQSRKELLKELLDVEMFFKLCDMKQGDFLLTHGSYEEMVVNYCTRNPQ